MYIHQNKELPAPHVTPLRLPELVAAATKISQDIPLGWNRRDNIEAMKRNEHQFREWFKPFIDLDSFPHMYFLNNGITQGLEWLGLKYFNQKIHLLHGDYFWLKLINVGKEVDYAISCEVAYRTDPSAITGEVPVPAWPSKIEIYDGAYVGTSLKRSAIYLNTEYVLLGFSKNIGFPELRCGLLLSKQKLDLLPLVQRVYGYTSMRNFAIVSKLIEQFSIERLADALKEVQRLYCEMYPEYELVPADSAILATTTNEQFKWYKRPNGIIRVPLGESATQAIHLMNRTKFLCRSQ